MRKCLATSAGLLLAVAVSSAAWSQTVVTNANNTIGGVTNVTAGQVARPAYPIGPNTAGLARIAGLLVGLTGPQNWGVVRVVGPANAAAQ